MSRKGGVGGITRGESPCLFVGYHLTDTLLNITYKRNIKYYYYLLQMHIMFLNYPMLDFFYHPIILSVSLYFCCHCCVFQFFFWLSGRAPRPARRNLVLSGKG